MIAGIIGIIGSIFGIIGGVFAMMFGTFTKDGIGMMGFSAIVASVCGIIGAILALKKDKTGGWLMIIASVWGLISISMFYILSFILLLIAGLVVTFSKTEVEKKSKIPFIAFGVSLLFMVLIFSTKTTSNKNSPPKKIENTLSSANNQKQQDLSNKKEVIINVGETAEIDDKLFKVVSIQRNYPGGQYSTLPTGKEWVLVNVYIENKGQKEKSYNSYDFKMEDSSGDRKTSTYVSDVVDELHSGDLAQGGKKLGNIVFEVPKDDKGLKLIYEPNMFTEEKVIVKL